MTNAVATIAPAKPMDRFKAELGARQQMLTTLLPEGMKVEKFQAIVVTAVAWVVFRETPQHLFLAGLVLAIVGALTLAHGAASASVERNTLLGDALSVGTAVWYALYFLAVRKARQSASAPLVMFWSSLVAAPVLLIVSRRPTARASSGSTTVTCAPAMALT